MTIREVIETADKNDCAIYCDDVQYESVILEDGLVKFYEISERRYDNEDPDFYIKDSTPAKIADGVATVRGRKIELRKSVKFPIL